MNVVSIIPVRSGSKRIRHKNIKLLAGKPLMYYQINASLSVGQINKTVVATDDEYYAQMAMSFGAEVVMRPQSLSGDNVKSEDVLLYVLDELEKKGELYDVVAFMQATSPLNKSSYVQQAISLLEGAEYNSISTYVDFYGYLIDDSDIVMRPMSQNKTTKKLETGCFWLTRVDALRKSKNRLAEPVGYLKLPQDAQYEIDTYDDLTIVESLGKA